MSIPSLSKWNKADIGKYSCRYLSSMRQCAKLVLGSLSNHEGDSQNNSWRAMNLYFTVQCVTFLSVTPASSSLENTKNQPQSFTFSKTGRMSFHVVALQRTTKKDYTDKRAQQLFCSIIKLFVWGRSLFATRFA